MTNRSVNEPSLGINRNKINEALLKSEALLQIGLNSELQNVPAYVMHDYLWVLSDLITCARKLVS